VLTGARELFLVSMGLTYFLATTGSGLRVLRAHHRGGPDGVSVSGGHRRR
jgi:hypothetical protein